MHTRDQHQGQHKGGGATINAQFCPFCGKPRPDPSAVFCAYCGRAIAAPGAPPPPPPPQYGAPAGMTPPTPQYPPAQYAAPQYAPPQYAAPQYGQYGVPPAGMPQPMPIVYGAPPGALPYATRKSVGVAILLETLLPGVGEMYVGRVGMGLAWLLGTPIVFGVLDVSQRLFLFYIWQPSWLVLGVMSLTWYATRVALVIGDMRAHNVRIPGPPQPVGSTSGQRTAIALVLIVLAPLMSLIALGFFPRSFVTGLVVTGMVGAAFWLALQRLPYARRGRVWGEVVLFGLGIYFVSTLLEVAYVKQFFGGDFPVEFVLRQLPGAAFVFVIGASLAFALAALAVRDPVPQAVPTSAEVLRNFPLAALCLIPELPLFIIHDYLDAQLTLAIFGSFYPIWPVVLNVLILLAYVILGSVMTARRFKPGAMAR